MTLSDNLAKLAQLIDFGKTERLTGQSPTPEDETAAEPKTWPWDWLRTALLWVIRLFGLSAKGCGERAGEWQNQIVDA